MNLENKTVKKKTREKMNEEWKALTQKQRSEIKAKKREQHTHTQFFLTICKKVYLFRDTIHCNRYTKSKLWIHKSVCLDVCVGAGGSEHTRESGVERSRKVRDKASRTFS